MAQTLSVEDLQLLTGHANVLYVASGSSLTAARDAASAGTLIKVGPGTHTLADTDCNLAKNGVHWHFAPGAVITITDASQEAWLFNDGGSAMSFRVTGHLRAVLDCDAFEQVIGVLRTSHADSVAHLEIDSAVLTHATDSTGFLAQCVAGRQDVRFRYVSGSSEIIGCDGGTQDVVGVEMAADASSVEAIHAAGGTQTVKIQRINGPSASDICGCTGSTTRQIVTADEIIGEHDCISCFSGTQVVKARRLTAATTSGGAVWFSAGTQIVDVQEIVNTTGPAVWIVGSGTGTASIGCNRAKAGGTHPAIHRALVSGTTRVELRGGMYVSGDTATESIASPSGAATVYLGGDASLDQAAHANVTVSRLLDYGALRPSTANSTLDTDKIERLLQT